MTFASRISDLTNAIAVAVNARAGKVGASAYDLYVLNGGTMTQAQWTASLQPLQVPSISSLTSLATQVAQGTLAQVSGTYGSYNTVIHTSPWVAVGTGSTKTWLPESDVVFFAASYTELKTALDAFAVVATASNSNIFLTQGTIGSSSNTGCPISYRWDGAAWRPIASEYTKAIREHRGAAYGITQNVWNAANFDTTVYDPLAMSKSNDNRAFIIPWAGRWRVNFRFTMTGGGMSDSSNNRVIANATSYDNAVSYVVADWPWVHYTSYRDSNPLFLTTDRVCTAGEVIFSRVYHELAGRSFIAGNGGADYALSQRVTIEYVGAN